MKQKNREAFTMIELVFVIVVIGILSAIAIPKLAATRDDAKITRGMTLVGAMRSAMAGERQKRILRGNFNDINGSTAEGLLEYGLGPDWSRSGDDFTFDGPGSTTCVFTVNNNKFEKGVCSVPGMNDL